MPRATVNPVVDQQRFELQSCEGGYVVLRRFTYREFLMRREMAMNLKVTSRQQPSQNGKARRNQRQQDDESFAGELAMANAKVVEYEFAHCIIEHNLEDESGRQLDFSQPRTLEYLDPRIGNEINQLIDEMNQFEREVPNSLTNSDQSSSEA